VPTGRNTEVHARQEGDKRHWAIEPRDWEEVAQHAESGGREAQNFYVVFSFFCLFFFFFFFSDISPAQTAITSH